MTMLVSPTPLSGTSAAFTETVSDASVVVIPANADRVGGRGYIVNNSPDTDLFVALGPTATIKDTRVPAGLMASFDGWTGPVSAIRAAASDHEAFGRELL